MILNTAESPYMKSAQPLALHGSPFQAQVLERLDGAKVVDKQPARRAEGPDLLGFMLSFCSEPAATRETLQLRPVAVGCSWSY